MRLKQEGKSWRTTIAGFITIVIAIGTLIGIWVPKYGLRISMTCAIISNLAAGFGLLTAKDANVKAEITNTEENSG